MTLLKKPVKEQTLNTLVDVKPTVLKIKHFVTALFSTVVVKFIVEEDVLAELASTSKLPDYMFTLRLRSTTGKKTVIGDDDTHTMTISPNGMMEFSAQPDGDELNQIITELTITGLESFKSATFNVNDVKSVYNQDNGEFTPYITVFATNQSDDQIRISDTNAVSLQSLTTRNADLMLDGYVPKAVTFDISWAKSVPVNTDHIATYKFWNCAPTLFIDFNNEWESPLFKGGYGIISGLIGAGTQVLVDSLAQQLKGRPEMKRLATALGVTAIELATQYLQALAYFTLIAKTRTIDSLTLDELVQGPAAAGAILGMGINVGGAYLSSFMGDKGAQLTGMIAAGGASFAIAAGYLAALGVNKYQMYW